MRIAALAGDAAKETDLEPVVDFDCGGEVCVGQSRFQWLPPHRGHGEGGLSGRAGDPNLELVEDGVEEPEYLSEVEPELLMVVVGG